MRSGAMVNVSLATSAAGWIVTVCKGLQPECGIDRGDK
jgi:hypothetical protein